MRQIAGARNDEVVAVAVNSRPAAAKGRLSGQRCAKVTSTTAPIVAVIDTGIAAAHPRLQSHLVAGWNVLTDTAVVGDDNGHGTQMAGIIVMTYMRKPNKRYGIGVRAKGLVAW